MKIAEHEKPAAWLAKKQDIIRDSIERFAAKCAADQYTDTGEAWDLLRVIYELAGGEVTDLSEFDDPDDVYGESVFLRKQAD